MSQNLLTNTTTPPLAGSTAIGVLNLAADSLARWFCGAATPTASAAGLTDLKGFVWHDTSTNTLKVRDQADTAWIIAGYFDETGKTFTPHTNPAALYAADTGSANAYAVAPTPAWTSYAAGGPLIAFVAANANTGAATINVSGLGTKSIVRRDGAPLVAGDIPGAQVSVAVWNQAAGDFTLLTQRETPPAFVKSCISNLKLTASGGARTVAITADAAVLLDAATNPYLATAISQTPSLSTSGAGGLDAGSVSPSTWYSVWLIWNGTTLSALFSLSATAPTLPSGYAYKARVGWALTDAASNIAAFVQYGARAQYVATGLGLPRMGFGSTSGAWTAIAWAAYAPPTARAIALSVLRSGNGAVLAAPNNSYATGYSATNAAPIIVQANSGTTTAWAGSILLESADIYWASSDSTDAVFAFGWEDNL
jgi:hypothetical protein